MKVPKDYLINYEERKRIVEKIFEITLGATPRQTDTAVCMLMSDREAKGRQGINNLIDVTCDYIWDHWMGEPKEPSAKEIKDYIKPIFTKWYKTTNVEEQSC